VAGDTCQGLTQAIESLRRAYPSSTEIVMVAGNHELWSRRLAFEEYFEEGHACKIARNTDPLRGDIASNSDPS
jgi:hypothetical protein